MKGSWGQADPFRKFAGPTLAAFLFLVLASFVAVPCLVDDAAQFRKASSPGVCHEHSVFKPTAEPTEIFASLAMPEGLRLPAPAAFGFALTGFGAVFALIRGLPPPVRDRRRRFFWLTALPTPFVSLGASYLPAFAASRDA
jgi:hypothetical protein